MSLNRREFVERTTMLVGAGVTGNLRSGGHTLSRQLVESSRTQPSFAVIPVVGDGKWIWTEPPADGSTGYLEPRQFEVTVGIRMLGRGWATGIQASTVAPISFPEQEVTDFRVETHGCSAAVHPVNESAAQFLMSTTNIERGQKIGAIARYRITLKKDYRGYSRESFPSEQASLGKTSPDAFSKRFLRSSPGINTRSKPVRELLKQLNVTSAHPWEQAKHFHGWVWENIEGIPGRYTSVEDAIKQRRGDCEERATVFIALCRAVGIPARLVWVPSHNWAEIGLYDSEGKPQWLPVHTAAYSWFGWTGAHEVILQKGDRIHLPARKRTMRLIDDWYRLRGKVPEIYFTSTVTPIAPEGQDPGPGAREKLQNGVWQLAGNHPQNSIMRDK